MGCCVGEGDGGVGVVGEEVCEEGGLGEGEGGGAG